MNRRRILQYAAIGGGAAVLVGAAVAAFLSMKVPFDVPTTTSQPSAPCSPQPCANVRGFILWVTDVKTDDGLVSMQLKFQNNSAATHADPADIQLIESNGHPNQRVTDAANCTGWPRTEFNNGAEFGPVAECFRPASTSPPLKLHWEPDFGPFCCETEIRLE